LGRSPNGKNHRGNAHPPRTHPQHRHLGSHRLGKTTLTERILFYTGGQYLVYWLKQEIIKDLISPSHYSNLAIENSRGILVFTSDSDVPVYTKNPWLSFLELERAALPQSITSNAVYSCIGFDKTTNTIRDVSWEFIRNALSWRKNNTLKIATLFNAVDYDDDDDQLDFTLITNDDANDRLRNNTNIVTSSKPNIRMITLPSRNSSSDEDTYEETMQEFSDNKWIEGNVTTNPVVIDLIYVEKNQLADIPDDIIKDLKSIVSVQEREFDASRYFNY
jgi:hypothetical protein